MNSDASVDRLDTARWRRLSFWLGCVVLLICAIAATQNTAQFLRAYLTAYLFYLGISLGSMVMLMAYHLTGGSWGLLLAPNSGSGNENASVAGRGLLADRLRNPSPLCLGAARGGGRQPQAPVSAVLPESHVFLDSGSRLLRPLDSHRAAAKLLVAKGRQNRRFAAGLEEPAT